MAGRKGIQLCYPFEERRLAKWRPPYILQPKLDGDRCRAIINSQGDVSLLSSEENIVESVPHIDSTLKNLHLHNVEFDGELYVHGAPHETIHGIVSRGRDNLHPDYKLVELHIFDIIVPAMQVERLNKLLDTIPTRGAGRNFGPLQIVPSQMVTSIDEIMKQLEIYMKAGFEGFVVRDAYAEYVRKRSTQMMKFKPRKDDYYEIKGYSPEVDKNGIIKEDVLGRYICGSDPGLPVIGYYPPIINPPEGYFSVGSGSLLTWDNRCRLWKTREFDVNKLAHVKYQHLTHARGVPRFPVVVEII